MGATGITTIVHRLKPYLENYFDDIIDNGSQQIRSIHRSHHYPPEVTNQRCWPHLGIFYDYLFRREIHVLVGTFAEDRRAEMFMSARDDYYQQKAEGYRMDELCLEDGTCIAANRQNITKVNKFLNSYEYYKDTAEYRTEDILYHIFNTSMLHMMYYGRHTVPFNHAFITWPNINDILKYVRTWDLRGCEINPEIDAGFFFGDADLILHSSIVDLKMSKYMPNENWETFKRGIYQMILYALGFFIETGQEMRTLKVYNPLLGLVFILKLPFLNFYELREMVKNDLC